MTAERIAGGVFRVLKGYVNAYLVETDAGLFLVDSGMPKKAAKILAGVRELGKAKAEIRSILITHHHTDHIGSLAPLVKATGATVYAPAADAAIIRGKAKAPGPNKATFLGKWAGGLVSRFEPKFDHPNVDVEVRDGDVLPVAGQTTVRAIHTPGHTAGQTSYLLERDGGVLLAGDVAGSLFGKVGPPVSGPIAMFTEDLGEAKRSFVKLATFDFEVGCFGHGGVIPRGASAKLREAARRFG